jgi:hypothetical protein
VTGIGSATLGETALGSSDLSESSTGDPASPYARAEAAWAEHGWGGEGAGAGTGAPSTPTVAAALTGSGTLTAVVVPVATVAASLGGTGTLTATVSVVPGVTAALAGAGTLSATVVPVAVVSAAMSGTGTLTATLAGLDEVDATLTSTGTLSAIVEGGDPPELTGDLAGDGALSATIDDAYVTGPETARPAHAVIVAQSWTSTAVRPTTTGTWAAVTTDRLEQQRTRHRDRILIAGRDITRWRGVATPLPGYQLLSPLLWGPASLELPQVHPTHETPGRGDLRWLAPGAPVVVQRVDRETGDVVMTDYRGVITAIDITGRTVRLDIGGHATGPAALQDKQAPIFRRRNDLGWWWWDGLRKIGRNVEPNGGPDTGIDLYDFGGMGLDAYLQQLSTLGSTRAGAQWTCMPENPGNVGVNGPPGGVVYRVWRKTLVDDPANADATVYLDDSLAVARLRRDIAEEPNRIYGTGVTPSGERARFGVYPALADTRPPQYPGTPIGPGADGDTDGLVAVLARLSVTGYLTVAERNEETGEAYDDAVRNAVRDVQADAGLPRTGLVDRSTWRALFDVDVTGFSTAGARVEPIVQRTRVQPVIRSASGNVIADNPDYDPTVLVVDRTVDFGTRITRERMRAWARTMLAPIRPAGAGNWVGTIQLNGGAVISGRHTPGDPLPAGRLMHARALRPGMTLWAPTFDGGTLLHVSGVDVRPGAGGAPDTVTVAVDTQARDTMQVWEVIARNRENRRNPARAWIRDHRSSSFVKDAVTEFDEIGGEVTRTDLDEGWNVFPVVAGQEGTIARLRLRTGAGDSEPREFVCAVFGKEVTPEWLTDRIAHPLTEAGSARWEDEATRADLDDRVLLYAAGSDAQPCGYFPKAKATDTEPGGPLTGRWEDDAGFGYRTFDQSCVLWVAIFVPGPTRLRGGRIMWPQLEPGA